MPRYGFVKLLLQCDGLGQSRSPIVFLLELRRPLPARGCSSERAVVRGAAHVSGWVPQTVASANRKSIKESASWDLR